MKLPEEALQALREALIESGFAKELESASHEDLEELALFVLNLTAAAVKTRERMRRVGRELPVSAVHESNKKPVQPALPGFEN